MSEERRVHEYDSGSDLPKISIVVPSYNQGEFIADTMDSVLDEHYPNLELIVVDGGSDDRTVQILRDYESHIHWWVSEPDRGQAHAINKGMQHATGEILAWLNSDDCLMPGALLRVAHAFMDSAETDVVYGHRVLIDEQGRDVGRWILPGHRRLILSFADFIPQETMFWRADLWTRVGGRVDESLQFALDWDLIRRFVEAGAKFRLLPAFIGQFRLHAAQKTSAQMDRLGVQEMESVRQVFRNQSAAGPIGRLGWAAMQRIALYGFLLRAKLAETLWSVGLKRID